MDIKDIEKINRDIITKKEEIKKLTDSVTSLSNEKISLFNEITKTKKDRDREVGISNVVAKEIQALNGEKSSLIFEIKSLKAEVAGLEVKKKEAEESLSYGLNDLSKAKSLVKVKEKDLVEKDKAISELESSLKKEKANLFSAMKKISDDQVETDLLLENAKNNKKTVDKLLDKMKEKQYILDKEIQLAKERRSNVKAIEDSLLEKERSADRQVELLDKKDVELEKKIIDVSKKEADLDKEKKSLENIMATLDVEKKKLKITQLRIDEIIRINGIEKELQALEGKR